MATRITTKVVVELVKREKGLIFFFLFFFFFPSGHEFTCGSRGFTNLYFGGTVVTGSSFLTVVMVQIEYFIASENFDGHT
jgi:hypothetical protein